MLRTVIVDDEPLAIERMKALLHEVDSVDVVGSASTGAEAVASIRELRPELAILDIEMPKLDGFDVVEALLADPLDGPAPLFCFVTAYPQFAPQAFDRGAVDFLCKPVRLPRLKQAIQRARAAVEGREAQSRLAELSTQLVDLRRRRTEQERFLWVPTRGEVVRVSLALLIWVRAEGEYVRLHVGGTSYLLRSSISSFCSEFADVIVQVHRSFAINRSQLRSIRMSRRGMRVVLSDGTELPVGRSFRAAVQAIASGGTKAPDDSYCGSDDLGA